MKLKFLLLTIIAIITTGCTSTNNDTNNDKLNIYTSVYPLQFIAEQLTKDDATVYSVYPPGVDAHTYEPAARDITSIAKADVFFYVGGHMESFSDSIAKTLNNYDVSLVSLINEENIFLSNEEGELDPHIWLDPNKMQDVAKWMSEKIIELDPSLKDSINKRLKTLNKDFQKLDEKLKDVSQLQGDTPLLVVHDAYRYWAEEYGIEQLAIHGMMAGEESSQKKLAQIAKKAETYNIQYIVFEQNNDDQIAHVVLNYLQAKKAIIHDLENLTDDNVKNGDNYISIMENNIETLENILSN